MSNQQVRQSELFAGEDWTVLYRAFTQINFNAYDPPSINAALKEYLQTHYPEDFNDWIESSEFVAVIDLLSWLAGSLAFRVDINARENFLETAQARESVLRLARFLSYNPRRSYSSRGLVKITRISTTESVYDSLGANLQNQRITWDDPDNPDWFEHFSLIFNAAMPTTNPFGVPFKKLRFSTGDTQLYRLNTVENQNCVYSFGASIEGQSAQFEIVNVDISESDGFQERAPNPINGMHMVYRNDGRGNASPRTGFFLMFKQGSLRQTTYDIVNSVENRVIEVQQEMINDTDVWVQSLNDQLVVTKNWTKVPAIFSDNISFTNISAEIRDIFSVITNDNDSISLRFSDGRFGNVPVGNLRAWYRVSNGMQYDLKPKDMENVTITIPYLDVSGRQQTMTVTFSLQESVANAVASETIEQIKRRAPQVYGTQNRMVSGEDYNIFPLTSNQIIKIRSVNRMYSGHSRFLDINDPTATYQDLTVMATDGMIYREDATQYNQVSIAVNITNDQIINNKILPMLRKVEIRNYMDDQFTKIRGGFTGFPLDVSRYNLIFQNESNVHFNSTGLIAFPKAATTAPGGVNTLTANKVYAKIDSDKLNANEGGVINYTVTLVDSTGKSVEVALDKSVEVKLLWGGVAASNVDVMNLPNTVTITSKQTSAVFSVAIVDDGLNELAENLTVAINGITGTDTVLISKVVGTGAYNKGVVSVTVEDDVVGKMRTALITGAKIKFTWNNKTSYRWAQIQKYEWIYGADSPKLRIVVDDVIPDNAVVTQVVPMFRDLPSSQVLAERFDDGNSPIYSNLNGTNVSEIAQLKYFISNKLPFALYYRYDVNSTHLYGGKVIAGQWIAQAQNAVVSAPPNSVEIMRGQFANDQFWILETLVGSRYIFESVSEMRWPWLENHKVVDGISGVDRRDVISVMWADGWDRDMKPINFDIIGNVYDPDGFPDPRKVVVSPSDLDDDGEHDDPGSFDSITPIDWKIFDQVVSGTNVSYSRREDIAIYNLESDVMNTHNVGDFIFTASKDGTPAIGIKTTSTNIVWISMVALSSMVGSIQYESDGVTFKLDEQGCVLFDETGATKPVLASKLETELYNRKVNHYSGVWIANLDATNQAKLNGLANKTELLNKLKKLRVSESTKWVIFKVDEADSYKKQYPVDNVVVVPTFLEEDIVENVNADTIVFHASMKTFKRADAARKWCEPGNVAERQTHGSGWYKSSELSLVAKEEGVRDLTFKWKHYAGTASRIDPSPTNIIDSFVLTSEYDFQVRQWLREGGNLDKIPEPPTALDLDVMFSEFNQYKMFSDEIVWRPVKYKFLFGQSAAEELRAQFKVVKLANSPLSDGEIRTRVISAVNEYFDVNRWEFGETFFYTELAAYVHLQLATAISSIVIVPLRDDGRFGNLFEVRCQSNEMFVSTAQVSDVVIIDGNTMANLRIK